MTKPAKRRFRITENPAGPEGGPAWALHDDTDEIVRVHTSPRVLADIAFDALGADEVTHDGRDLVARDGAR